MRVESGLGLRVWILFKVTRSYLCTSNFVWRVFGELARHLRNTMSAKIATAVVNYNPYFTISKTMNSTPSHDERV